MEVELARGTLEQEVGCIVALQRILGAARWLAPEGRPPVTGDILELADHLVEECFGTSTEVCHSIAGRWIAADHHDPGQPWTFTRASQILLPEQASRGDIRYFAMRAIRRRYAVPFSAATARLFHCLATALRGLSASTLDQPVPLARVLETISEASVSGNTEWKGTRNHQVFLEACLVLDLFEPAPAGHISVQRECADAEYLLSHLFGVPSGIPGFDSLFGGGGLMLADQAAVGQPPPGVVWEGKDVIGGRTILCFGQFGSGKTLISLQFAVDVARKGGVALVIALEQTEAECLYALEAIGVSTINPAFQLVQGGRTDSFLALCHPSPTQGALVFLKPEENDPHYATFLKGIGQRLEWMASYPLRLLVVDPVNALIQDKETELMARSAMRKMFEAAKRANVNIWITSEQVSPRYPDRSEENIADTVIHLNSGTVFEQQQRYVEVTKSRFQRECSGRHGVVIESRGGIHIYPSSAVITRMIRGFPAQKRDIPVHFGIPGMERLLGPEPIHPGDLVVLAGPGKAKTLMGLQYLLAEHSSEDLPIGRLLVSDHGRRRLDQTLKTIRDHSVQKQVPEVECCSLPAGYVDPGQILQEIQSALEASRKKAPAIRLLITNLARWEEALPFITKDAGFGMALVTLIRSYNAAAVVVCGDSLQRGSRLRDTMFDQADFLLHFHTHEFQGRTTTLVNAVKTRLMRHQRESFALSLEPNGLRALPAPLFRINRAGNSHAVPISLFLHAETENHRHHNDGMIEGLRATISPSSKIENQGRRLDVGMLQLSKFSAVDELQVFQMDEFQLPTVPAAQAGPEVLYSFDMDNNSGVLNGRLAALRSRVTSKDEKRFLAVPFYVNISFFVVDNSRMKEFCKSYPRFSSRPTSWQELAEMCTEWENDPAHDGELFFSCPVYEHSMETYNCLFLEILYSLRKPTEKEYDNISLWLQDPVATEAGYLFREICRRSHAKGYQMNARPDAIIARHWYNTLNQELSNLRPEDRAHFDAMPLFGEATTAGEWYLTVPASSASPEVGLRLIEQLTMPDRETQRVDLGVGLPTRTAYYESAEFSEASVSRYFHLSRSLVHRLLSVSIRRSQFRGYQRFSSTISTHLQWLLEIPDGSKGEASTTVVRDEIERMMKTLASDIQFLQNTATTAN